MSLLHFLCALGLNRYHTPPQGSTSVLNWKIPRPWVVLNQDQGYGLLGWQVWAVPPLEMSPRCTDPCVCVCVYVCSVISHVQLFATPLDCSLPASSVALGLHLLRKAAGGNSEAFCIPFLRAPHWDPPQCPYGYLRSSPSLPRLSLPLTNFPTSASNDHFLNKWLKLHSVLWGLLRAQLKMKTNSRGRVWLCVAVGVGSLMITYSGY